MKKLKCVLISLLACMCCFLLASCDESTYVENSFTCKVTYKSNTYSSDEITASGSFKVNLATEGKYKVTYCITVFDSYNKVVVSEFFKNNLSGLGEKSVSVYMYSHITANINEKDTFTAKISQIEIVKEEAEDDYKDFAIVFGVTGGMILIVAIVFFVMGKLKEKQ